MNVKKNVLWVLGILVAIMVIASIIVSVEASSEVAVVDSGDLMAQAGGFIGPPNNPSGGSGGRGSTGQSPSAGTGKGGSSGVQVKPGIWHGIPVVKVVIKFY